jgi:mono/diheme cytochrome c family protein
MTHLRISRLIIVKLLRTLSIAAGAGIGGLLIVSVMPPIHAAGQAPAPGAAVYAKHCADCHGDQLQGKPPAFPGLTGISQRMTNDQIAELIRNGKGRMPAYPGLQGGELTALLEFLATAKPPAQAGNAQSDENAALVNAGSGLFLQNCAFCHGRDAMGGETGPDLTESELVRSDTTGEKIAAVIREGRPDNKMPAFTFSAEQVRGVIAFIRARKAEAEAHPGGRRGVSHEDLQTGNVEAGKKYFEGAGGCVKCHSADGDLSLIARHYQGLRLEERMLYPRGVKGTVTVTLPSGKTIQGELAYRDEFTIALRDNDGIYRSWSTSRVRFKVDSPVDGHIDLLSKYSDDDVHNLMAYLQTLR